MRNVVLLALLILCAGSFLSAGSVASQESHEKRSGLSTEQLARAKTLFSGKCARCHGADGRGQTVLGKMLGVPDFTDGKWWKDHVKDDLVETITKGDGDMPAFGKKLTRTEISLLADYVREFNKTER